MRAITIDNFGGKLEVSDVPTPDPKATEVQIKIHYTAVNPVDWKIRDGYLKDLFPHHFPLILGWDAAGVVTAVGENVSKFQIGDEVYAYCRKPEVQWGTYAEFICLDADVVALKPKNLSFAQAASIPLVGLTAWQALFDVGELKKGENVLVQAGAGGVGSMAIQFAKHAKAFVFTTASQTNHSYVKDLGADVAIDYNKDNFISAIKLKTGKGVDLALDFVGGKTLEETIKAVRQEGRVVSIVQKIDPMVADEYNIKPGFVFVRPNGEELAEIAKLIEEHKVHPPYIEEMNILDVELAHEKVRKGHTKGKIVLKI